jgi:hypothetical protein
MRSERDKRDQKKASLLSQSEEFSLRPWREVARLFSERSGQKLSRRRAWQIGQVALRKLRAGLQEVRRG